MKWYTAFLFTIVLAACKKSNQTQTAALNTIVTGRGNALGTAISKTIGAAGGTLTSTDGKITITVPAGAVSGDTEFSILPVSNTLQPERGNNTYRLLPESVGFAKDLTLTFHYNENDFKNAVEDGLLVAYQTTEGSWKAVPTALDKPGKRLTVTTTHFSDWTIVSSLYLHAEKTALSPNGQSFIELRGVRPSEFNSILGAIENDDDVGGTGLQIKNWKIVSGPGSLEWEMPVPGRFAEYTAPASAPQGTTVTIQVELAGLMLVLDPQAPDGFRRVHQMILLCDILLMGDSYMVGDFNGREISISNVTALAAGGTIFITGHDESGRSVGFELYGNTAKDYACGERFSAGKASATATSTVDPADIYSYGSVFTECTPTQVQRYTDAAVQLTTWGAVGEPVTGEFTGKLYTADGVDGNGCPQYKTRTLSVEFRAIREL